MVFIHLKLQYCLYCTFAYLKYVNRTAISLTEYYTWLIQFPPKPLITLGNSIFGKIMFVRPCEFDDELFVMLPAHLYGAVVRLKI